MKKLLIVCAVLLVSPCVVFATPVPDPGPILKDHRIPGDYYEKFGSSEMFLSPSTTETSEYLYGDVSVAVILLESNGAIDVETEDWDQTRIDQVHAEIVDGLDWWITNKHLLAELSFTYHHYLLETSYEPITRISYDEDLWINEVMGELGYTDGNFFNKVRSFDHDLRTQDNTDWAFTIFVVDSLNDSDGLFDDNFFAYAYGNGPFMVMTYDNHGYSIENMDAVTAHELGHIFGAIDEYSPCTCAETGGILEVENQNCQNSCSSDVGCIMRGSISPYTNNELCPYSEGQIGWRDLNSNGIIDCIDSEYNSETETDVDGIVDYWDNCPNVPNPDQLDTYPPLGNAIGDACDCECDFTCDGDVDSFDLTSFLADFGRGIYDRPCTNAEPCNGDASCDGDVDSFDITEFLADFGRGFYDRPCPACQVGEWCVY